MQLMAILIEQVVLTVGLAIMLAARGLFHATVILASLVLFSHAIPTETISQLHSAAQQQPLNAATLLLAVGVLIAVSETASVGRRAQAPAAGRRCSPSEPLFGRSRPFNPPSKGVIPWQTASTKSS